MEMDGTSSGLAIFREILLFPMCVTLPETNIATEKWWLGD